MCGSEFDFSSGCLISNISTKKKENSNSVTKIINYSKMKTKFYKEKSFFRFITKTQWNYSKDEQKILIEKILMVYKKADYKIKESEKESLITFDPQFEIGSRLNQSDSGILSKNALTLYVLKIF